MDAQGIHPLEDKVEAIQNLLQPTLQHEVGKFLGLVKFYHLFLLQCASVLQPLNLLLSIAKNSKKNISWSKDATAAFTSVKEMLAQSTFLIQYIPSQMPQPKL